MPVGSERKGARAEVESSDWRVDVSHIYAGDVQRTRSNAAERGHDDEDHVTVGGFTHVARITQQ